MDFMCLNGDGHMSHTPIVFFNDCCTPLLRNPQESLDEPWSAQKMVGFVALCAACWCLSLIPEEVLGPNWGKEFLKNDQTYTCASAEILLHRATARIRWHVFPSNFDVVYVADVFRKVPGDLQNFCMGQFWKCEHHSEMMCAIWIWQVSVWCEHHRPLRAKKTHGAGTNLRSSDAMSWRQQSILTFRTFWRISQTPTEKRGETINS